ncbi:hypothetical protein PMm318_A48340 [Pseudomonas moorei]
MSPDGCAAVYDSSNNRQPYNPEFIAKHIRSQVFLSFYESADYKVETDEAFKAIPDKP